MSRERRNFILAAAAAVALTVIFLISDRLKISLSDLASNMIFFVVLVPLLEDLGKREAAEKRQWMDIAWLVLAVLLFLFCFLRTAGIIPGPQPKIKEFASALLLLYVGIHRVVRPRSRPFGQEAALLFVAAAALLAFICLTVAGYI